MLTHEAQQGLQLLQGFALRRPTFCAHRKQAKAKGFALGERGTKNHFFCMRQKKRSEKPSRLSGARFRLAATYFLCAQKVGKDAPGVGRGRTSSAKGALLFEAPAPPDPRFSKEQDKRCFFLFPAWGKPTLEATIFRCRSSGSRGNVPGPRDTPASSKRRH